MNMLRGGAARQTAIVEARRAGINETLLTTPGAATRLRDEMEKDKSFTGGALDPIAEKAKRLNADFYQIGQHLKTIGELVIGGSFQDAFSNILETVDGWLKRHKDDIVWFSNKAAEISGMIADKSKEIFTKYARLTAELWNQYEITQKIHAALKGIGEVLQSFWDGSITGKINSAVEWAFQPFKWLWEKLQSLGLVGPSAFIGGGGTVGFGPGEGTESGGSGAVRRGRFGHGGGGGKPGSPNANFTAENAKALRESAARLGTTPEDLATVIGYETVGTFSPSKWGGAGGRYMGLIQFGPPERAQYGANENQSFKEQLGAVERYLKDRGFKPGTGINNLYSTILAGRPGLNRADSGGTVNEHVERMKGAHRARALLFLKSGEVPAASTTQGVIPGQGDPHKPGFDPSSVKFHDYFPQTHSSLFPPDLHHRLASLRGKPLGQHLLAHNEIHDHRSVVNDVNINVASASPADLTVRPLGRPRNADLIRNTAAYAV